MKRSLLLAGITLISLAACRAQTPGDSASSQSSSIEYQETKNVLYRGTLQEAGVSIFMQGTHRLLLDDGRFILLESEAVNLDKYVGQKVEVFGSVRPTVEAGGQIMRVESVRSLEEPSSSSQASAEKIFCGGIAGFACPDGMECIDDPSDSCDPTSGGADCGGMCIPGSSTASSTATQPSSAAASVAPASSRAAASSVAAVSSAPAAASSAAPVQTSSAAAWDASADLTAKAELMAKDDMSAARWTQQYCSSTIGFCIPVHKNWWFKSFGATSSAFWHLEIGPGEMNNLGEGPLTVRLVSGTAADGQVSVTGGAAVGTKAWTGNRHFEIRGPSNLESAVRYITEQLKPAS